MFPTRAQICERVRRIQEDDKVTFTDDEVKAMIYRAYHVGPEWEDIVVRFAAQLIREREEPT